MEEGVVGWCQRSATGNNGGSKCGRWNPTAEQVKVLTDLFKSGLRTPSTDQIQKISCQLSSMGKIESKNVFYWFQNHKARERHHTNKKRRRHALNILTYTDNCSEAAAAETVSAITLDKDRGIETLELFPLTSSSSYSSSSTWIARRDYHKESAPFSLYSAGNESLLDLRLGS